MRHIAALMVTATCGCASMPTAERVWLSAHLVDVAQTVQVARSDCFWEDDPVTRRLIGEDPSTGEALAWGVAWGGLHYGVTRLLERVEAPGWLQAGWQVFTIGNTLHAVKQNVDQGVDLWEADCHPVR